MIVYRDALPCEGTFGSYEISSSMEIAVAHLGFIVNMKGRVNYTTKTTMEIADQSKLVNKLGKFKVLVEILPFLAEQTIQNIENKGCKVTLRPENKNRSDNGNIVIDSDFGLIDNVQDIQTKVKMIPGVVEVGIFHGMTWKTIVGKNSGVEEINYK